MVYEANRTHTSKQSVSILYRKEFVSSLNLTCILTDPHPPRDLGIEKVNANSVILQWQPPVDSEFTEYWIKYRTDSEKQWVRLPAVTYTGADVTDMTRGEKYTIQVNSVSHGVESPMPLYVNHTISPNAVEKITPLIDSNNITLEWPRPEGRIEKYLIMWWPSDQPEHKKGKNVSEVHIGKFNNFEITLN